MMLFIRRWWHQKAACSYGSCNFTLESWRQYVPQAYAQGMHDRLRPACPGLVIVRPACGR